MPDQFLVMRISFRCVYSRFIDSMPRLWQEEEASHRKVSHISQPASQPATNVFPCTPLHHAAFHRVVQRDKPPPPSRLLATTQALLLQERAAGAQTAEALAVDAAATARLTAAQELRCGPAGGLLAEPFLGAPNTLGLRLDIALCFD